FTKTLVTLDLWFWLWWQLFNEVIFFFISIKVSHHLTLTNLIQRWLGDINISCINDRTHVSVKQCQQQGSNMRTIDIGIGHDDNFVISSFRNIEVFSKTSTHSCKEGSDFFVSQNLVHRGLFNVQNLT